jgi:hypothetical protein
LDSNFNSIDFTTENASLTVQGGVVPSPEPSGLLLFGAGLVSLAGLARRKVAAN